MHSTTTWLLCSLCLLALAGAEVERIDHTMCDGPKTDVKAVALGSQYLLTVDSNCVPPQTADNLKIAFLVVADAQVYIQYIHTYFTGNITYSNATDVMETSAFVESPNEVESFKKFSVKALKTLEIAFTPPRNETLWTGVQALILFIDPENKNCPQSVTFDNSTYIVSDYNATEVLETNSVCMWNVPAPADGSVAVKILHFALSTDIENLTISGDFNGSPKTVTIQNSGSRFYQDVMYFDGALAMVLTRDVGEIADGMPQVRILVNPVVKGEKACSLPYKDKTFFEETGKFTNIVPYKPYEKNEKCTWMVTVPKSKYFIVKPVQMHVGWFSGERLTFGFPSEEVPQRIEKDKDGLLPETYVTSLQNDTANVIITWESDSFYEYNGFEIDYTISDNDGRGSARSISGSLVVQLLLSVLVYLLNRSL